MTSPISWRRAKVASGPAVGRSAGCTHKMQKEIHPDHAAHFHKMPASLLSSAYNLGLLPHACWHRLRPLSQSGLL